jgi:hypothetical protein
MRQPKWFASGAQDWLCATEGISVSRQVCKHRAEKLPDNHSCGARCSEFPACLPPFPPEAIQSLINAQAEVDWARGNALAVRDLLQALHGAIQTGLSQKRR